MLKARKIIYYLNYLTFKYLLKQGGKKNFISPFSSFFNKKNISIGEKNQFLKYSKILSKSKKSFIKIGDKNIFDFNSTINSQKGYIIIGNNNFIGPNNILQGFGGLKIGNHCMIAGNTFISSSNHNWKNPQSENYLKTEIGSQVIIEDKVWIGANCVITAGVKIGKNSIIGAGSVVTKNIDSYTLAFGSPAKKIKYFDFDKNKWINY